MIAVDSSAVIALLLREPHARRILDALTESESLLAPALMPYEVLNALHAAVRHDRLAEEGVGRCLAHYLQFPWALDIHSSSSRLRDVSRLAARHGLSAYDAAFLEIALRHGCPLVTLDAALREAAVAELVEVRPTVADRPSPR